jgi:hypothetical protein
MVSTFDLATERVTTTYRVITDKITTYSASPLTVASGTADGSGNYCVITDTTNSVPNSKLIVVRNQGAEKAYMDAAGNISAVGALSTGGWGQGAQVVSGNGLFTAGSAGFTLNTVTNYGDVSCTMNNDRTMASGTLLMVGNDTDYLFQVAFDGIVTSTVVFGDLVITSPVAKALVAATWTLIDSWNSSSVLLMTPSTANGTLTIAKSGTYVVNVATSCIVPVDFVMWGISRNNAEPLAIGISNAGSPANFGVRSYPIALVAGDVIRLHVYSEGGAMAITLLLAELSIRRLN